MRFIHFAGVSLLGAGLISAAAQDASEISSLRRMFALEESVSIRGEAVLASGQVIVALPPAFAELCEARNMTVHLTCKDGWSPLWASSISGTSFSVSTTREGQSNQPFWWEVKAVCKEKRDKRAR